MHLYGVGGRDPPKLAKLLKTVEKSMETCKPLKIFMIYESIFIQKANFNNNKGEIGGLLEIINNSKIN